MSQSSPITPLASNQVNHDQLTIELIEPDGMPAMVRIVWPSAPTIVDPKRFRHGSHGRPAVRQSAHRSRSPQVHPCLGCIDLATALFDEVSQREPLSVLHDPKRLPARGTRLTVRGIDVYECSDMGGADHAWIDGHPGGSDGAQAPLLQQPKE